MKYKRYKAMQSHEIGAKCQLCGMEYSLDWHIAHLVARHWEWLEKLHEKPDLIDLVDSAGV